MKKYCLDGDIANFDFHDGSGFWSFCGPKSLKAFLADLKAGEKAEIEINSPGGSVIAGVEMANAIKNSGAHLIAHVTGMAASMASVIACACDEIVMEEASFMMIHDPWADAQGNATELRKQADLLDQMKTVIMSFYRGKFSCGEEKLAELMSEETWYTGVECLENGLACTVVKSDVRVAAKVSERHFAKIPEAAKAYFNMKNMPEEIRAAVEAARAACDVAVAPGSDTSAQSESVDSPESQTTEAQAPASTEAQSEAIVENSALPNNSTTSAGDWEARYKGASKKINELQAKIESLTAETVDYGAVVTERDGLKDRVSALTAENQNFKDQLEKAQQDLAAVQSTVSVLTGDLEKSNADLAACRERAEKLENTRDLLTGGVLSVSEGETYAAKMAAAKTPEERENLRALKKAGKIN